MDSQKLFTGYDTNFLDIEVPLPLLGDYHKSDVFCSEEFPEGIIPYIHYSLALSKLHKFPFFTATNIDGKEFKKVPRKDHWRKDPRALTYQWGMELYRAEFAKFDRGHMTKREDAQWGESIGIAFKGADSTFFYTNSVPQHKNLNRSIWRSLEDYILAKETVSNNLKINVYTGPVLNKSNPLFISKINTLPVMLPILFWKVVIYKKSNGNLYRVGFLMNQKNLLEADGLIQQLELGTTGDDLFQNFRKSGTYQVNIQLIEDLTNITMPMAAEPYVDQRPIELVLEEVDIDPDLESYSFNQEMGFSIKNLTL